MMGLALNVIRVSGAWATAIMMLIAGMPQTACACAPTSGRQPAPEGVVASAGCSCGGSCCTTSSELGSQKSCCQKNETSAQNTSHAARVSGPMVCKIALASRGAFVASTSTKPVTPNSAPTLFVLASPPSGSFTSTNGNFVPWRLPHQAPPSDLLALLQHFLI
jgi:hypothetical protein